MLWFLFIGLYVLPPVVGAVILYWIVKRAVRQGIIEAQRAARGEAQRATRRNDGWEVDSPRPKPLMVSLSNHRLGKGTFP